MSHFYCIACIIQQLNPYQLSLSHTHTHTHTQIWIRNERDVYKRMKGATAAMLITIHRGGWGRRGLWVERELSTHELNWIASRNQLHYTNQWRVKRVKLAPWALMRWHPCNGREWGRRSGVMVVYTCNNNNHRAAVRSLSCFLRWSIWNWSCWLPWHLIPAPKS